MPREAPARPTTAEVAMRVVVSPDRVLRFLLWIVGVLLILSSAALALYQLGITPYPAQFLSVGANQTLAGWVSMLLAVAAGALALTASVENAPPKRRRWWVLAVFFALISFDEFASAHDRVGTMFDNWLNEQGIVLSGPFRYGWVILGLIVAVALVAYFVPFSAVVAGTGGVVAGWGLALMVIGGLGGEMAANARSHVRATAPDWT